MQKEVLLASCLFIIVTIAGACRKEPSLEAPQDYDVVNRALRITVSSRDQASYSITIKTSSALSPGHFDSMQTTQNSGAPFNFAFTPAIGSTVYVKVESDKDVSAYVFYKGVHTWKITMMPASSGSYMGEFSYEVKD